MFRMSLETDNIVAQIITLDDQLQSHWRSALQDEGLLDEVTDSISRITVQISLLKIELGKLDFERAVEIERRLQHNES